MSNRIQLRRDTLANWTSTNPILADGEIGYETDTGKIKIGNGETVWTGLGYFVGAGEANTASNVGTAGVGVFKQKSGIDLQFKKINAGSAKITITDDTSNNEVDIDVVTGTDTNSVCIGNDSRLSDSRTPTSHGNEAHTSAFLVSETLSMGAGEINTLAEKTVPASNDLILIEDSANGNAKKKVKIGNLPTSSFKYGLYTLSAAQTSNLTANNHVEFDTSQGSLGGLSLGAGQADGIISLPAGNYKFTANTGTGFSAASPEPSALFAIYNRTSSTVISTTSYNIPVSRTANTVGDYTVVGILSTAEDITIDFRIISSSLLSSLFTQGTWLLIEEYKGV